MNIEELSKSQLILLTILVNFVTSIATGILTVSLLDHVPAVVTQTINRVVDHTIETVAAPAAVITAPTPAPSTQELVTSSLAAANTRFVQIFDGKTGTSTPALAIGTYLPKTRAIVTAAQAALPMEVLVQFPDNSYVPASLSHQGSGIAIYGFADSAKLFSTSAPTLVAAKDLKLGETALAIAADGSAATGIVSRVSADGVRTTLPEIGAGSAAVDLSGNLIGIAAGGTAGLLIPTDSIVTLLTATSTAATSTPVTP